MAYVHLMTGVSSSMIIINRLLLLLLSDGNIEIQRPLGFTKVSFVMLVCLRCVLADRICRQPRYAAVKLNMRRGDLMLHSETASRCYHPPACTRSSWHTVLGKSLCQYSNNTRIDRILAYLSLVPSGHTGGEDSILYAARSKMIQDGVIGIVENAAVIFHRGGAVQYRFAQE